MPDPLDQVLPRSLFNKCKFISVGATGWVFEVAPGRHRPQVPLHRPSRRVPPRGRNVRPHRAQQQPASSPALHPELPAAPRRALYAAHADSLDGRLQSNRRQDPKTLECFEVLRVEPTAKIGQWAAELASALAWLETLGVVQGDLRPANLLLDGEEHLKLVDFDSCAKFGDRDPGLPPPWSSPRHKFYGADTEQFAFGSILYNMTRGVEPYEDKGPEAITLFRNMVFPELSDSRLDALTLRCWRSEFTTLADLATCCATLEGAGSAATAGATDDEYMRRMKRTCKELLSTKLADLGYELPRDKEAGIISKVLE